MLSQRRVDDAAVEQDLGRVGNLLEASDGIVELVVVICGQRGDPGLNLLLERHVRSRNLIFKEERGGYSVYRGVLNLRRPSSTPLQGARPQVRLHAESQGCS